MVFRQVIELRLLFTLAEEEGLVEGKGVRDWLEVI